MAGFFSCSFARVAAKNSVYDVNGKVLCDKGSHLEKFLRTFAENKEAFSVIQKTCDKRLPVLLKNFDKWQAEDKRRFLKHFSSTSWASLSAAKRGLHTVSNCKACQMNHLVFHSLFHLRSNRLRGVDPVAASEKEAAKAVKPSQATVRDTAKEIYLKINQPFKEQH